MYHAEEVEPYEVDDDDQVYYQDDGEYPSPEAEYLSEYPDYEDAFDHDAELTYY